MKNSILITKYHTTTYRVNNVTYSRHKPRTKGINRLIRETLFPRPNHPSVPLTLLTFARFPQNDLHTITDYHTTTHPNAILRATPSIRSTKLISQDQKKLTIFKTPYIKRNNSKVTPKELYTFRLVVRIDSDYEGSSAMSVWRICPIKGNHKEEESKKNTTKKKVASEARKKIRKGDRRSVCWAGCRPRCGQQYGPCSVQ